MNFKNNFIITALFLLLTAGINAQEVTYGIQAGIVSTQHFRIDPNPTNELFDPIITFSVNGYLEYKGKSFFGISVEPGYIQKGGLIKSLDYVNKKSYAQLPILANLYLLEKVNFSIGPEFSLLNGAGYRLKPFELSGILGLGFDLHKKVYIGFKYSRGLTKWIDLNEYNQYFQFYARYKIFTEKYY